MTVRGAHVAACAALGLALLGAGWGWRALRHRPGSAGLPEAPGSAFAIQPSGPGQLVRYLDGPAPLRALRWLPPLAGDTVVAQVLGQNDRQRIALLRPDTPADLLLVSRPAGVADSFWRFAALDQALLTDGTLLLLYRAGDAGSTEAPLLLAMDRSSQQPLWWFRGPGNRLVLGDGPEAAVYLYGGAGPIQRLPLKPGPGADPARPSVRTIPLPPALRMAEALLPTGTGSFLVSHPDGLAAYRNGAWTCLPAPEARGQACRDWHSTLARSGRDLWWQAVPGQWCKVRADGHPVTVWPMALPDGDPFSLDAGLVQLLGTAPDGALWFALATPVALAPDLASAQAAAPASGSMSAQASAQTAALASGSTSALTAAQVSGATSVPASAQAPGSMSALASAPAHAQPSGSTSAPASAPANAQASDSASALASAPAHAQPSGSTSAPASAPANAQASDSASAPTSAQASGPASAPDWAAYLAQGQDRVYRWDPARHSLARGSLRAFWASLSPPPPVPVPAPGALAPAAGALLAEGSLCAWWVPLAALAMVPVGPPMEGRPAPPVQAIQATQAIQAIQPSLPAPRLAQTM
jgi:hypothetical protein